MNEIVWMRAGIEETSLASGAPPWPVTLLLHHGNGDVEPVFRVCLPTSARMKNVESGPHPSRGLTDWFPSGKTCRSETLSSGWFVLEAIRGDGAKIRIPVEIQPGETTQVTIRFDP